eukprot:scaffold320627_cov22-Prasinocladus_malaysianus.AAC.1
MFGIVGLFSFLSPYGVVSCRRKLAYLVARRLGVYGEIVDKYAGRNIACFARAGAGLMRAAYCRLKIKSWACD